MSGACARTRRSVSNVLAALASASPGPAMPSTVSRGNLAATASTFIAACAGESSRETTPGRDSLQQSYWMLQAGATAACIRA